MKLPVTVLAIALVATHGPSQLPPSERLSPEDQKAFHTELDRLQELLTTASDQTTVMYVIARTWASAGQYRESLDWLDKVIALNEGIDPARDPAFAKLSGVPEFEKLLRKARDVTPPVARSKVAFLVAESDLFPENLAYDAATKQFYFGSTLQNKIVRCSAAGQCQLFANGIGFVLGLKVDAGRRVLWATSNGGGKADLLCYNLNSGALVRRCSLKGNSHVFNDLAINSRGDVFVTDTRAGSLYRVPWGADELNPVAAGSKFAAANGITLSTDGDKLYVADFGDGISVVDLSSGAVRPIGHPPNLCLATIDGLYFYGGSLIAIQNGYMSPRVVRFFLTANRNAIRDVEILERRNPLFDGVTTGVIAGNEFYYMANNQVDKVQDGRITPGAHLNPIKILKLDLKHR